MVKKFRRAAAGLDEQLPSDLRPPHVLKVRPLSKELADVHSLIQHDRKHWTTCSMTSWNKLLHFHKCITSSGIEQGLSATTFQFSRLARSLIFRSRSSVMKGSRASISCHYINWHCRKSHTTSTMPSKIESSWIRHCSLWYNSMMTVEHA